MKKIFRWFTLGLYTIITIIPYYFYYGITCLVNPKKSAIIKYKGKPIIPIMIISLTLIVYFICIFVSSRWYVQRLKINYLAADIAKSTIIKEDEKEIIEAVNYIPNAENKYANISFMSVDFTDLLKKNPDTVAWIKVNNTNVNYSVVQSNDNDYYLHHDFNKNYNIAGWVFADFRDDFTYFGNNTIIYAHNMTNRSMFGSLVWALKESWHSNTENQFIKLSTPASNTVWRIFSIYSIKSETYYIKTYFETEKEHQEFLDTITKRSIYNFNEPLSTNDKVLTLSTCSDDGTQRVVIHAKMVKAEYR